MAKNRPLWKGSGHRNFLKIYFLKICFGTGFPISEDSKLDRFVEIWWKIAELWTQRRRRQWPFLDHIFEENLPPAFTTFFSQSAVFASLIGASFASLLRRSGLRQGNKLEYKIDQFFEEIAIFYLFFLFLPPNFWVKDSSEYMWIYASTVF